MRAESAADAQRGTAILEMALILPVFLLLTLGTIDLGRAVYARNALSNAARDGARFGTVDPTNSSCIQTIAARGGAAAGLATSGVTIARPGGTSIGQPVTVSVQSSYQPLTTMLSSLIGGTSFTLRASASMQIRNVPPSALACP